MKQDETPISRRDFARTAALTAGALSASAATAAAGPAAEYMKSVIAEAKKRLAARRPILPSAVTA